MQVDIDFSQVTRLQSLSNSFPRAASRALNDTLKAEKTYIIEAISEVYNVNKTIAKPRFLKVINSNASNLAGALYASARPLPLITFIVGNGKDSQGVKYMVKKNKGTEVLRGAFIATMASGHRGVFIRKGPKVEPKTGRYEGTGIMRQPIFEQFRTETAHMMIANEVVSKAEAYAYEIIQPLFMAELDKEFARFK
jgi:hypothetical protein